MTCMKYSTSGHTLEELWPSQTSFLTHFRLLSFKIYTVFHTVWPYPGRLTKPQHGKTLPQLNENITSYFPLPIMSRTLGNSTSVRARGSALLSFRPRGEKQQQQQHCCMLARMQHTLHMLVHITAEFLLTSLVVLHLPETHSLLLPLL